MPPERYRISNSARVNEEFRAIAEQARAERRLPELIAAVREVYSQLQSDPLGCGESREELPHLGLPHRIVMVSPVVVSYGVSVEHRLVWISRVRLMPLRRR
jgi:hypothetical protein